jgi:hypothetical protein
MATPLEAIGYNTKLHWDVLKIAAATASLAIFSSATIKLWGREGNTAQKTIYWLAEMFTRLCQTGEHRKTKEKTK